MRKLFRNLNDGFVCGSCGAKVVPLSSGGHNRNHCPFCLASLHVDETIPGDRLSNCHGLMPAFAVETRRTGEHVLLHRCVKCGKVSKNRIAADDDFEKVIALSLK
jgi:ribosome biogenesis GTPase / thiamine phosphate phosphatase